MKFVDGGITLLIEVKRHYPIQELFNLMRDRLKDKFGEMELRNDEYGGQGILVDGVDKHWNMVSSIKNMIFIRQTKEEKVKGSKVGDVVENMAIVENIANTSGIFTGISNIKGKVDGITSRVKAAKGILNIDGSQGNRELMKSLGEEIERLINDPAIATSYFSPETVSSSKKSKGVAIVLSLFLGILGIDRLYLGYIGMGILKLITFGLVGILWLIDLIRIIAGNLRPKNGDYS